MPTLAFVAYTLLLASTTASAATFKLHKEYSGKSFFDDWDFASGPDDITHGANNWLNQSAARSSGLTSINKDGRAIIKVDDTTDLPSTGQQQRNSISISTRDYFPVGSVFILDANHIPFGCSVWPAFWTRGQNWPNGGEIDVIETVNLMQTYQMALHTLQGCSQPQEVSQLGKALSTDCSAATNSQGCAVMDSQDDTVGEGFSSAGGGVWAVQLDPTGIFIWFWSRNNVPSNVKETAKSVDPSTWGTPSAAWPGSSCRVSDLFSPQQLIISITLCGDFAGKGDVYRTTCGKPGVDVDDNTCYTDNVVGSGTNYADAFFDINYLKVFSRNVTASEEASSTSSSVSLPSGVSTATGAQSSGTSLGNATTSTGVNGTTDGNGSGNSAPSVKVVGATIFGAAAIAAFAWEL